jgi:hypothetical protein
MVDHEGVGGQDGWIVQGRDKKLCQMKGAQDNDVGRPYYTRHRMEPPQVHYLYHDPHDMHAPCGTQNRRQECDPTQCQLGSKLRTFFPSFEIQYQLQSLDALQP